MIEVDAYTQAQPQRNTAPLWTAVVVCGGAFLGSQVVTGGPIVRVVIALTFMLVLAVPAIENPRRSVQWLFVLLPFMGVVRHMFIASTGAAFLDPLLLLTSAVALAIFMSLALNDEMDFGGTTMSLVVFMLIVISLIQAFNPGQGSGTYSSSLLVGATGIMINVIPISYFFIGRSISDLEFTTRIIRIVITVGIIAALYGLVQVFIGFRGFEQSWLATQGYTAATVGETTRPFSIFNNAAEYAAYAHFAFVAAFAAFLFSPRSKRSIALIVAATIAYSGFLIGSRGFTVKVLVAVIILLAARARNRLVATGVVIVLAGAAVFWSATTSSDSTIQEQEAGSAQLIEQQLRALRDPLNPEKSTLPVHFTHAMTGLRYAVTEQPVGLGTGITTRGGSKFGGLQAGTEMDISDAFLSLGILGGVLYVLAIAVGVTQASRVRRALPGPVWIAIWAMAATSIGAWLTGGNYAVTPLIWFLLGAADGEYKRLRDRGLLSGPLAAR